MLPIYAGIQLFNHIVCRSQLGSEPSEAVGEEPSDTTGKERVLFIDSLSDMLQTNKLIQEVSFVKAETRE